MGQLGKDMEEEEHLVILGILVLNMENDIQQLKRNEELLFHWMICFSMILKEVLLLQLHLVEV